MLIVYNMRIYTVYLSTYNTTPVSNNVVPIDVANPANATWMVDWNNLFKGEQFKYKRCSVRFSITSNPWAGAGTNFYNFSIPLTCNLSSMFHSGTTIGTVLGILHPETIPTGGTQHAYIESTLSDAQGVDVNIPSGVSHFTITFGSNDTFSVSTVNSVLTGYIILLQFELSMPVDEKE
jgi:hypothetical protein